MLRRAGAQFVDNARQRVEGGPKEQPAIVIDTPGALHELATRQESPRKT